MAIQQYAVGQVAHADSQDEATIGPESVAREAFVCELRLVREPIDPDLPFPRSAGLEDLLRFLFALVREQPVEVFGAVFFDDDLRAIGYTMPYRGTTNRVGPEGRHLVLKAWSCRASSMVVFHNHPSGRTRPSEPDLAWTEGLIALAHPLGVLVRDHLVLGREPEYCSIADTGLVRGLGKQDVGTRRDSELWTSARGDGSFPTLAAETEPRARRRARPKYRDPRTGKTWAGRGSMARWLEEYLEQGRSIDEFEDDGSRPAPKRRRRRRARPKFRDPATGNTWSGRGTMAKWLQDYVDEGRSIEEFRIGSRRRR